MARHAHDLNFPRDAQLVLIMVFSKFQQKMAPVCRDLQKLQEGKELGPLATPVQDHRKVETKENRKEGQAGKSVAFAHAFWA